MRTVVVEGTRDVGGGVTKVSFHFVMYCMVQTSDMAYVNRRILEFIQSKSTSTYGAIASPNSPVLHVDEWGPLVGMDTHAASPNQGLAGPWARKAPGSPISRLLYIEQEVDGHVERVVPENGAWLGPNTSWDGQDQVGYHQQVRSLGVANAMRDIQLASVCVLHPWAVKMALPQARIQGRGRGCDVVRAGKVRRVGGMPRGDKAMSGIHDVSAIFPQWFIAVMSNIFGQSIQGKSIRQSFLS